MLVGWDSRNNKPLPYDAEVEWIESSGTQYINTLIKSAGDIEFEIDAIIGPWFYVANNDWYLIGYDTYYAGDQTRVKTLTLGNGTSQRVARGFNYSANVFWEDGRAWPTTRSIFQFRNLKYIENGIVLKTVPPKTFIGDDMYLFGVNQPGAPHQDVRDMNPKMRCFGCKMWKGGTLIRDMIPVRLNSDGAMYDRASGQLFSNAGTGTFIVGPDK